MPGTGHGNARHLEAFDDADAALGRIERIYATAAERMRRQLRGVIEGDPENPEEAACYPYVGIEVGPDDLGTDTHVSWGIVRRPGVYGTTVTRPGLFRDYLRAQLEALLRHHRGPLRVGVSDRFVSLPFLEENAALDVGVDVEAELKRRFRPPDIARIDDSIANGTHRVAEGQPMPLALFTAERVDLSLDRLHHYTGTRPEHFQSFVLFTNYNRYVEEFIARGRAAVARGEEFVAFVEPGDVVTRPDGRGGTTVEGERPAHLPQMCAYHAVRADRLGVTLVNIGVGPSNAKTLTDHLAVLRPQCWLMLGHCGGLRRSQRLGDYVLAHAYVREDHVLNQDLPSWIPLPAIAEVQIALEGAVAGCTGLRGPDLKRRMRTGTVVTTDNRNWELRFRELYTRFSQSRAIAVDMESATIAGNGFRFRIPYGALLCVSDRPLHGELKLRNAANTFYRASVAQHLSIGLEAVRILRGAEVGELHSRKLRSFEEPPFF